MALGSTQTWVPGIFPGGKGSWCIRLTTLPPSCAVVMKSGNLNFLEPSGPLQACKGTALPFLPLLGRGGWSTPCHSCFTPPRMTQYPLYRWLGGPPRLVQMGVENLAPTGIWSPDHPTCSQPLYWLHNPTPQTSVKAVMMRKISARNQNQTLPSSTAVFFMPAKPFQLNLIFVQPSWSHTAPADCKSKIKPAIKNITNIFASLFINKICLQNAWK